MPVVLERPLVVKHRSNWCSGGSCCVLIHWGAAIVLPFVIAFAAGGLWTKEVAAREQPLVRFRHEALVEAYRLEPSPVTGEQPVPVKMGWSTSGPLNDALGSALRPCELRSWEEDDDRDGKADSLRFHLKVPLDEAAGERLHSLTFMVGVSALFSEETTLALNGTATVAHSSALPGARWRQSGELQVRRSDGPFRATVLPELSPCSTPFWMLQDPVQVRRRRPARRTAHARAPCTRAQAPRPPAPTPHSPRTQENGDATTAAAIAAAEHASCNTTAVFSADAPLWTPGVGSSFELDFTVRVPSLALAVRPGTVEVLKLAWVQYITILLPIFWVLGCVRRAAVVGGVVPTRVHHPQKPHAF